MMKYICVFNFQYTAHRSNETIAVLTELRSKQTNHHQCGKFHLLLSFLKIRRKRAHDEKHAIM